MYKNGRLEQCEIEILELKGIEILELKGIEITGKVSLEKVLTKLKKLMRLEPYRYRRRVT